MANNKIHKDLPKPLVFSGPSGSGKSTLIKRLKEDDGEYLGFSVSHTTRKPRPGEKDGVDYHYTNREDMIKAVNNGEFIETAEFSGNMYGTSKKAVEDVVRQHKVCILDIDMQGVKSVRKTDLNPIYIFVKPPSMEVLESRLRGRQTESEEAIQKRLQTAKKEMEFIDEEHKNGSFVVINDDIEVAYQHLRGIIMEEIAKAKNFKYKSKGRTVDGSGEGLVNGK
ncbi:Guanylate kinase [Holothuria leucospilota]|uniref:guanylate kinase n=1 Tax=Holothuria leucospilota TaxID=206669 RepID=A0A9Q0YBQ1_HOLLE|nr:Guanylate kinase [Holothuria leucospilota]